MTNIVHLVLETLTILCRTPQQSGVDNSTHLWIQSVWFSFILIKFFTHFTVVPNSKLYNVTMFFFPSKQCVVCELSSLRVLIQWPNLGSEFNQSHGIHSSGAAGSYASTWRVVKIFCVLLKDTTTYGHYGELNLWLSSNKLVVLQLHHSWWKGSYLNIKMSTIKKRKFLKCQIDNFQQKHNKSCVNSTKQRFSKELKICVR